MVFGGNERNTKRFFIIPVLNRSVETLLSIIQQHVAVGSIIHTDKWCAYNVLSSHYTHKTVNHTVNFVDPTGVHIQNIERLWKEMRANIPRYGIRDYHFTHYLAEFIFKKLYKYDECIDAFFNIMSLIYTLNSLSVK